MPTSLSANPDIATTTRSHQGHAALSRQAIVDERRAVFGYELFERPRAAANDDALLFDALSDVGSETLAGKKQVFIQCSFENMADGHVELLDPETVVLEIRTPGLQSADGIEIRRSILERVTQDGFRLAFDHAILQPAYASWLPLASFIKLDMDVLLTDDLGAVVRSARTRTKAQVVADQIKTSAQYEQMKAFGVKLFQGNWFAQPAPIPDKAPRSA